MATNSAKTWAEAATQNKPTTVTAKDQDSDTDAVTLTADDIKVDVNEDGDTITLTLADATYTLDLDTAEELTKELADANPNTAVTDDADATK